MSDTRDLEVSVGLQATPAEVWKVISEGEELQRWFPLEARVEPGVGGKVWVSWGDDCSAEGGIEIWEPESHLRYSNDIPVGEGKPPIKMAVDYHIEARGGATILRLVHSGFGKGADWDGEYDATSRGWAWFMLQLKFYMERHLGTPRSAHWLKSIVRDTKDVAWQKLMGAVRASGTPDGELAPGRPYRFETAGGTVLEGEVMQFDPPFHFAGSLPALNDAVFLAEIEPGPEGCTPSVLLSAYGAPESEVARLASHFDSLIQKLFPKEEGDPDHLISAHTLNADGESTN